LSDTSPSDALRWLMGQPQGRVVLRWLVDTTGFREEVFALSNSQMSFNAGRRAIGVELLHKLRGVDENQFNKIIGELL